MFSALTPAGVRLLNQSALLKGVNDSADAQVALNENLFAAGIQPYYLHVLDKVQASAHVYVSDQRAKKNHHLNDGQDLRLHGSQINS